MKNFLYALKSNSSEGDKFIEFARLDALSMYKEELQWIEELRKLGVKAAHPNDGWVGRQKNTVLFAYPQFNDGAKEGDLVALGSPKYNSNKINHIIVRLKRKIPSSLFFTYDNNTWEFEKV